MQVKKDVLANDLETVISCLKMKRKYLQKNNLPKPLTLSNVIDEDIDYLEEEILPSLKRL